jgi:hypothetical protein
MFALLLQDSRHWFTVCVFITAVPNTKLCAWGRRIVEDMCYEIRRAEACVVRGLRPPDATGSRHTTQPAYAGVGCHHTTVSPLFFIAYPQTRVPAPSVLGPCVVAAGAGPQPMLSIALKLAS